MKNSLIVVCLATAALSLVSCSGPKQPEQPSKAEQERQEKEYQKSMEQVRKFTEGSKAVLDKPPQQQPAPRTAKSPQPEKQPAPTPSQDHQE
jgi:outer membrane biogenesis lipoprotein LolB